MQILPHPPTFPKKAAVLMYSVITSTLLAAIIIVLATNSSDKQEDSKINKKNQTYLYTYNPGFRIGPSIFKDFFEHPETTTADDTTPSTTTTITPTTTPITSLAPIASTTAITVFKNSTKRYITIQDVVDFEDLEKNMEDTTWLSNNDNVIAYLDTSNNCVTTIDVTDGIMHPCPENPILDDNGAVDAVKIGKTEWLLHAILQKRPNGQIVFNIAITKESIYWNLENMPWASDNFKPLLNSDICVTRILAAPIISEDEAFAYFIAAPLDDVESRYLYRVKVVYPPLQYSTLEPIQLLTGESKGNDFEISNPGREPRCAWTEALISPNGIRYILKCRGKDIPWSVVVNCSNNRVLRRIDRDEAKRLDFVNIIKPTIKNFNFFIAKHKVKARLYLPDNWNDNCLDNKTKLIVRLAEKQNGQMVTKKHDLSITVYLATVKRYALLYTDVRGSKFHSLEYLDLRYRMREDMQANDYYNVVQNIIKSQECIERKSGFGIIGMTYGGHQSLNLLGLQNEFRCAANIAPVAPWRFYVYPFNTKDKPTDEVLAHRERLFKSRVLSQYVRKLRNKDFVIYKQKKKENEDEMFYVTSLVELLQRQNVKFELKSYGKKANERYNTYDHASNYFGRCFAKY